MVGEFFLSRTDHRFAAERRQSLKVPVGGHNNGLGRSATLPLGWDEYQRSFSDNLPTVKPADEEGTGTPKVDIPMSRPNNKVVKIPKIPACPVSPRGFRIAEAAVYMGVSPWFVEQEIRAERLPALRLCRHYTLLQEDLDAYLDDAKKRPAQCRDVNRLARLSTIALPVPTMS